MSYISGSCELELVINRDGSKWKICIENSVFKLVSVELGPECFESTRYWCNASWKKIAP